MPAVRARSERALADRAGGRARAAPLCAELGLDYQAFGPLGGGWLTGKYRAGEPFPEGSRMTLRPGPYEHLLTERTHEALDAGAGGRRPRSRPGHARARLCCPPGRDGDRRGPRRPEHLDPALRAPEVRPRRGARPAGRIVVPDARAAPGGGRAAPADGGVHLGNGGALSALARGEVMNPLRSITFAPGGGSGMGLMPVHRGGDDAAWALKTICVVPDNPQRGLDAHQAPSRSSTARPDRSGRS